ncbi:hypothetical protein, partial [Acidovorax kalamii]|uniref:hypothetical protein n=1 Tax=Acidovorax kalamii TaxID=2004485 RepID=UPI00197AF1C6
PAAGASGAAVVAAVATAPAAPAAPAAPTAAPASALVAPLPGPNPCQVAANPSQPTPAGKRSPA